ncbi:MAG: DNA polymerase III subunit beta [Candidatus Gastranaerophilaceae bacterium]
MEFLIKKEDLFNGIRIVERATAMKGLQPVLANILIETVDKSTLRFCATDLDLTVIATVQAQVKEEGKITLPAKKLSDIVSRLSDSLVTFKLNKETNSVNLTSKNTKFDIIGISASEFPPVAENIELLEENAIEIDVKPFTKAIRQAGFAAAGYESNNLLSGVVCDFSESILEMASTDGNRLARVREKIENTERGGKTGQLIIPSKTLQEFIKMSAFIEEERIKIFTDKTKLIIKSENTMVISRLMEGQYPKYNQLIPQDSPKIAVVNISQLISSLERVAIMVNERTSIVKFEFKDNKLVLTADTPDSGASEDEIDVDYSYEEELKIAFNYRYVLDSLKNMETTEVKIGLNTTLSATVLKPNNDEDYVCLIMPVQIRG